MSPHGRVSTTNAFVIDAFARRIVGWRASRTAHAGFVLDALEQALHDRRPAQGGGLIHHSDRGSQYLSITYTERLKDAGVEPSVGSVGDSYDNALAETINGLYKTEVINRRGPWRSFEAVEFATLEWVDWFNNRRLLEPIGNIRDAKADLVAVGHLDHVIAQRARELARGGIVERPDVVLGIELALVVVVRPTIEAAVQAALEIIAARKRADLQPSLGAVGELDFKLSALQGLPERVVGPHHVEI